VVDIERNGAKDGKKRRREEGNTRKLHPSFVAGTLVHLLAVAAAAAQLMHCPNTEVLATDIAEAHKSTSGYGKYQLWVANGTR